ncbi:MAG: chorismate mutase, partial [Candidatus Paceibacterota bacterium]
NPLPFCAPERSVFVLPREARQSVRILFKMGSDFFQQTPPKLTYCLVLNIYSSLFIAGIFKIELKINFTNFSVIYFFSKIWYAYLKENKSKMDKELINLRKEIDKCDRELINILSLRFKIGKRIGEYKRKNKMNREDKKREKEILLIRKKWGNKKGLDSFFIERFFNNIFKEIKKNHKKIFGKL